MAELLGRSPGMAFPFTLSLKETEPPCEETIRLDKAAHKLDDCQRREGGFNAGLFPEGVTGKPISGQFDPNVFKPLGKIDFFGKQFIPRALSGNGSGRCRSM
jgi:hypothetical protein